MLRHACGFKLANDGHNTRAIQAYLGHRSIMSTVQYTALTPNAPLASFSSVPTCCATLTDFKLATTATTLAHPSLSLPPIDHVHDPLHGP
jgi:Phage integrase family